MANAALRTSSIVLSLLVVAQSALATEGYFLEGYGTRQKGLAGAGAADSRDPLALSINPAGLVDVDHEFTAGLTAFSPDRGYETSGPGFVAPGPVQSGRGLFPIPNAGTAIRSMRIQLGASPFMATAA